MNTSEGPGPKSNSSLSSGPNSHPTYSPLPFEVKGSTSLFQPQVTKSPSLAANPSRTHVLLPVWFRPSRYLALTSQTKRPASQQTINSAFQSILQKHEAFLSTHIPAPASLLLKAFHTTAHQRMSKWLTSHANLY